MRRLFVIALAVIFAPSCAVAADYIIDEKVPSIAGLTSSSTFGSFENDLNLEEANFQEESLYVGEGICESGVVVDKDSDHEFAIYFVNAEQFDCYEDRPLNKLKDSDKISYIKIPSEYYSADEVPGRVDQRPKIVWKTSSGISISTTLEELEEQYGDIKFLGFGWDYGGGCCFDTVGFPKAISLMLLDDFEKITIDKTFDYMRISGDQDLNSKALPKNVKDNISVSQIRVELND